VVRLPCGHQLCHGCAVQLAANGLSATGSTPCPLCKTGFIVEQLNPASGELADVPGLMTIEDLEKRCRIHFLYLALQGSHPNQPSLDVHAVPPIIHPACRADTLYNTAALKGSQAKGVKGSPVRGGSAADAEERGAPASCSPTTAVILPLSMLLVRDELNPALVRANVEDWPKEKIKEWVEVCDPDAVAQLKTIASQKRWLLEAVELLQAGGSHCHMFVAALMASGGTLIMCCPHGVQVLCTTTSTTPRPSPSHTQASTVLF
jgi:hypothetical protein